MAGLLAQSHLNNPYGTTFAQPLEQYLKLVDRRTWFKAIPVITPSLIKSIRISATLLLKSHMRLVARDEYSLD